jgi:adenine-specific DNA methylase
MNKKVYVDLSQQDVQDIINAYEKDIEKFNKQKEVLDKIKEYIKNTEELYLVENYEEEGLMTPIKNIKELLEEIE